MTSEVGAANVMVIEGILGIPRPREVDSSWHTAHRRPRPLQTSIAFHAWLAASRRNRWIAGLADFLLPGHSEGSIPLRLGPDRVPVKRQER